MAGCADTHAGAQAVREVRAGAVTIPYVYSDTGIEIPVVAISAGKVFFRRGRLPYAVSRPHLERKGKAYDRVAKTWLYLEQGEALASAARARQKRLDQEAEAMAQAHQWRACQALPAGPGLQKREIDGSRLYRLKMAMVAAHPDHGGTSEAFIAARKRYLSAKSFRGAA
jgi:hypothetical protein